MKIRSLLLTAAVFLVVPSSLSGQHAPAAAEPIPGTHGMRGSHRLSFGLGHTHVSEGKIDEKTEWLTLASFSLNYDYGLSDKVAVGLQSDLVLETFFIETAEGDEIERSYPITLVPVGIYKVGKHLGLIAGVGLEVTKAESLALSRLGFEYGFHVPKNWEISLEAVWDVKWDYYDSWLMGFTISKILPSGQRGQDHHG